MQDGGWPLTVAVYYTAYWADPTEENAREVKETDRFLGSAIGATRRPIKMAEAPPPPEERRAFEIGYYVPPNIHPEDRYGGMYIVWVSYFAELFNQTQQHWALVPQTPSTPKPQPVWRSYTTSAKIRFRCERCGHAWTSMHGQVTFHYFLHRGPGAGTVHFQLFGQKCRECVERAESRARTRASGTPADTPPETEDVGYANPMWYPDEVRRVLRELFSVVVGKLYPQMPAPPPPPPTLRRYGRPQQPHNPALCQGCAAGFCRMLKR